jgi:hypothetical protein
MGAWGQGVVASPLYRKRDSFGLCLPMLCLVSPYSIAALPVLLALHWLALLRLVLIPVFNTDIIRSYWSH